MAPATKWVLTAKQQFPQIDIVTTEGHKKSHNALILDIVVACYNLGCISGALSTIAYGNIFGRLRSIGAGLVLAIVSLAVESSAFGRLRSIGAGLVLAIVSLAVESSAFGLVQLIIGRLLVGCAVGILSASIPIWPTECSTKHRGMFVIMEGIFISAGITLPNWISFGTFKGWQGSTQWRVTLILPVVLSIFAIPWLFFVPESPRWLILKGRVAEARQAGQ